MNVLAILGLPGGSEWLLIAIVALLLFGRRLPEVARSFGRSIVEFKKGMQDIKDNVEATPPAEEKRRSALPSGPAAEAGDTTTTRNDEKAPV